MADEKDWNSDDEIDPVKVQKEALELGKKYMGKMESLEKELRERNEQTKEALQRAEPHLPTKFRVDVLTPEQTSAACQRSWVEVKSIMPDAPDAIKLHAFNSLVFAFQSAFLHEGKMEA